MPHARRRKSAAMPRLGKNDPPIRIFKSDRLERFTLISINLFLGVWVPLLVLQIVLAISRAQEMGMTIGLMAGGMVVWFIFEYVMHRFLFHLKSGNRHIDALVWMMHTNHHIQPSHRLRTLMPLSVSLPLAALFELSAIALLGDANGAALMAGFVAGYFIYDLTHYACHNFGMKSPLAAHIKRHHLRHHYVSDEHNFSITVPLIDSLFSTRD